MKTFIRMPAVAAISALLMLSLSGGVWAGGGDSHYRGGRDHGNSHRGYSHSYPHYRGGYVARPYHYKHKHKNNHSDDDEELLIGLLVGGLFGYAISNAQRQDAARHDSYPPVTTLPPQNPASYPAARYDGTYQHGTCLQEREYQTTVTIGGKQVQAYGTACLQPDGSWRRDSAQMAAY